MKPLTSKVTVVLATMALAGWLPAQDDDPFAEGPETDRHAPTKLVGIHLEWFEADEALARRLLAEYTGSSDAKALRDEAEKSGARVLETAYIATRSGQRAKVESLCELIYPMSGDPPEIPQELKGPIAAGVKLMTPRGYTSFDARNTGTTMEVDPVLSADGQTIDVNIAPEMVFLSSIKIIGHEESIMEQPIFVTSKMSTAVTVPSGDTILLGVHQPMDKTHKKRDPSKRILLFLTATAL
jgi:hypothetical protein